MANDVHQMVILAEVASEFVENVLYFEAPVANSSAPATDSQDLYQAFLAHWSTHWLAMLPSDYTMFGFKTKRVNNTGGPVLMSPIAGMSGGRGAAAVASSIGPVILGSYVEAGKHRSGRIFLAGTADGDCIGNEFAAGLLTAITTFEADLTNVLAGSLHNWTYGIWSRVHTIFHKPDLFTTSLKVGQQNRRLKPVL